MSGLFDATGGTPTETPRSKAEKAMRELNSRNHAASAIRAAGRNASADDLREIALEILREAEAKEARR